MAKAKKAKKAGLRARSASVKAAMSVADEVPAAAGKPVTTTVRLDPDRHDQLRTLAFHTRRSMHSLLVEGVDLVLAKHTG